MINKETGEALGKSKLCAYKAVLQTSISRIALVATIFLPPLILVGIERANMIPRSKPLKLALEISLLAGELYVAVPLGLAMYSRTGTILAEELEEEFRDLKDSRGNLITEF